MNSADEAKVKAAFEARNWRLIEKVVMSQFKEQRRARRWGIFFKFIALAYALVLLFLWWGAPVLEDDEPDSPHVALINMKGVIADDKPAGADAIISSLDRAYENPAAKAIILQINSPGGSPVQAGYIYDEIKRLQQLHPDKKCYAVIEDIGASGGYYAAAAADEIYADKASIVGSIGVISSSFGFVDLMDKLGVERRTMTSGKYKDLMDPFSPRSSEVEVKWQQMLDITHQQFISKVKEGRGDRLKQNPDMFTGMVWTGEQAQQLGLVDALGSARTVARDVVGVPLLKTYEPSRSPFDRLTERLGVSVGETIAQQMGFTGPSIR
ncbi:signal peptide peptidase SppA [Pokkaliibacter sp. CJK22405]|uniref:signal peptide peptidase SppA n=1 Tax=Pokkaliibacter sp. CJK22405 TaxID=3384615 RepID=UPI003985617F